MHATPIEFLKGIGPKRAEALVEDLGIRTCGDLLFHLPFRYEDRTRFHRLRKLFRVLCSSTAGIIRKVNEVKQKRGSRLEAEFCRRSTVTPVLGVVQGRQMGCQKPACGQALRDLGPGSDYKGARNMAHPEVLRLQEAKSASALHPVYSSTERLGDSACIPNGLVKAVRG